MYKRVTFRFWEESRSNGNQEEIGFSRCGRLENRLTPIGLRSKAIG